MTSLEVFEAPYLGMDTESVPNRLARGYGTLVKNGLTGRPGRVSARGSLELVADLSSTGKAYTAAWVRSTGEALLAPTDGTLTMKHIAPDGTVTNVTVLTADTMISPTHCWVGDIAYGLSQSGHLLRWDGGSALTGYSTNAPWSFIDIVYWRNRLWCLGGTAVPDATVYRDRLIWSDLFDAHSPLPLLASAWQDDVSGLTNQIVLGSVTDANQPVGIGTLPRGLVVFGTQTSDLLVGDSPTTLTVREAAVTHGCRDSRTIVEYNDSLLWLARDGFYAFDGSSLDHLSARVVTDILIDCATYTFASVVRLPNNHLLLTFSTPGGPTSAWMLNIDGAHWSRFTTQASAAGDAFTYVEQVGAYSNDAWACDDKAVWSLVALATPGGGDGTDQAPGAVTHPIELAVDSEQAVLASPVARSAIQRLAASVVLEAGGTGACTGVDADGATLFTSDLSDPAATIAWRTAITEVYGETNTVQLQFSVLGGAGSEIGDAYVEYQPAQKTYSY